MFKICSERGETDQFIQNLNQFVKQGGQYPDFPLMQNLLRSFRGQNPSIKSQIAFATFSQSFQVLENDRLWLQILKQMIIIDRLMQQNLFLEEISNTYTFWVGKKKTNQVSASNSSVVSQFLNSFWKIIKIKTQIITRGTSIFNFKRSQRSQFLLRLQPKQILAQISAIQQYLKNIFDFIMILSFSPIPNPKDVPIKRESSNYKEIKSNIYSYLTVQILYKLFTCYGCQKVCNQQLLKNIVILNHYQMVQFKNFLIKFLQNSNSLTSFISKYKFVQGFQIVEHQDIDNQSTQQLVKILELLINQTNQEQVFIPTIKLPSHINMKVQQSFLYESHLFKQAMTPRLKFVNQDEPSPSPLPRLKKKISINLQEPDKSIFSNWNNSYSAQFPQKQIMTVDLIVQLKLQESQQKLKTQQGYGYNQFEINQDRSCVSFSYQNTKSVKGTSTTGSEQRHNLIFKQYPQRRNKKLKFKSIFSQHPHKWNT